MLGCPGQRSILLCDTLRHGYQSQQPPKSYMSVVCITNICMATALVARALV